MLQPERRYICNANRNRLTSHLSVDHTWMVRLLVRKLFQSINKWRITINSNDLSLWMLFKYFIDINCCNKIKYPIWCANGTENEWSIKIHLKYFFKCFIILMCWLESAERILYNYLARTVLDCEHSFEPAKSMEFCDVHFANKTSSVIKCVRKMWSTIRFSFPYSLEFVYLTDNSDQ